MNPLSIICLTETWISIDDTDIFSFCNEAHYSIYLHPCNSVYGSGIGELVHADLQPLSTSSINIKYGDCISCTFNLTSDPLRIITIYQPPTDLHILSLVIFF